MPEGIIQEFQVGGRELTTPEMSLLRRLELQDEEVRRLRIIIQQALDVLTGKSHA